MNLRAKGHAQLPRHGGAHDALWLRRAVRHAAGMALQTCRCHAVPRAVDMPFGSAHRPPPTNRTHVHNERDAPASRRAVPARAGD
eukprot:9342503-Pyramimonas_sp.AAC.1